MEYIKLILEQTPIMTLFLVIGLGYALGEINLRGFSLGVGAVLFVGLAVGAYAPKSAPPGLVGSLGLVMFLYGIGIQYGRQFFSGLTSPSGRRYNILAVLALSACVAVIFTAIEIMHIRSTYVAGMFAGSMTSTATLQAAMESAGNSEPAIGYSVAYPFGVIGPILCMYIAMLILKPRIEPATGGGLETVELIVRNPGIAGKTLCEISQLLPLSVQVIAVRQNHVNRIAHPELVLEENNVVMAVGNEHEGIEQARQLLGEYDPRGRILAGREKVVYSRVFASKRTMVGTRLADLKIPGIDHTIVNIRRGDTQLLPRPNLILEFGDLVGVLVDMKDDAALRKAFGDSIKSTTEFSYISIGIGMVLGVILGSIPFPIPGLGTLELGLAGGPLIMALILGKLGRTGIMSWTMPISANLTLRNFGLTLFLAQVGMSSGPKFVATVHETGFLFLAIGAAMLLSVVLITMIVGYRVMKIPFDDLLGITAGVTGNPAILAYAAKLVPTDRPDIGYAVIFPGATILKIIIVQIVIAVGAG
jgi:putative transport protein